MSEFVFYPVSLPVAYAVAMRLDDARVLVVAFGSVAKVAFYFPTSTIFRASFGEFCSCLGTSTFASLAALVLWAFSSVCLCYA